LRRVKNISSRRNEAVKRSRVRRRAAKPERKPLKMPEAPSFQIPRLPRWLPIAASITLVVMITATVNFRAYSSLSKEEQEHQDLNQQVQEMTEDNLGIQEEIYYLKNDPATIEREAKKYGFVRPDKKFSRVGEVDKAEASTSRQTPTR
jgi:cell division protein FtsB